jgi:hypothetical protein
MRKLVTIVAIALAVGGGVAVFGGAMAQEAASPITGENYLYIEEFEIGPHMVPDEAIAKASGWVREYRKTGEFKSVRLYIHNTGPRFSLYIFAEPKNWQSIETGFEKFFAANPEIMSEPLGFGRHTDNLLSEVSVE